MISRTPSFLLPVLCLVVGGCGAGDPVDTSSLSQKETQQRVDDAVKNVESSEMSPEQKQAAAQYLRQGAANAEQMRQSAGNVGSGG